MWNGRIWLGIDIPIWHDNLGDMPPESNINNIESVLADDLPVVPHFSQRLQDDR